MDASNQSSTSRQTQALTKVILDANTCIEHLLTLLAREREALTTSTVDDIDACVKLKVGCVSRLEQLDKTRAELCQALSLSNEDIEQHLSHHDSNYPAGSWETLLVNLQKCRDANAVNGSVTRVRRSHVEKALQVLRGADNTAPALYGPDGLEHTKDVTTLGQA